MKDELKPCPFCGGKAQVANHAAKAYSAECIGSHCVEMAYSCETEAEAIAAWNRRATPAPMSDDALVEAIKRSIYETRSTSGGNVTLIARAVIADIELQIAAKAREAGRRAGLEEAAGIARKYDCRGNNDSARNMAAIIRNAIRAKIRDGHE